MQKTAPRLTATAQLLLLFPALLFMGSLILRGLLPQGDLSHAAQQIVMWYAGRLWTLWILLSALPLGALVLGCALLAHGYGEGAHLGHTGRFLATIRASLAMLMIAAATVTAGVILTIVGLHVLAS